MPRRSRTVNANNNTEHTLDSSVSGLQVLLIELPWLKHYPAKFLEVELTEENQRCLS
jgi:hypothetical protein